MNENAYRKTWIINNKNRLNLVLKDKLLFKWSIMLSITNLNKTYPNGVKALKNLSLEIPKGIFGLLGPNGAGKSTLMRSLADLQNADSGTITLKPENLIPTEMDFKKQLGYLPQDFGLYPSSTAKEFLHYLASLKGYTKKENRELHINELLLITNLLDHQNKKLEEFSGGMKQRFGLAQALIGWPNLLILDEPTTGLDPEERNRIHTILHQISSKTCVILSTHIINDVQNLCPLFGIINNGKLLTVISPEDAIKQLDNKIWIKNIQNKEKEGYIKKYQVLSNTLHFGSLYIRVYSDTPLNSEDFKSSQPQLEDFYFSYIKKYLF